MFGLWSPLRITATKELLPSRWPSLRLCCAGREHVAPHKRCKKGSLGTFLPGIDFDYCKVLVISSCWFNRIGGGD
jgi:hypothetical protein